MNSKNQINVWLWWMWCCHLSVIKVNIGVKWNIKQTLGSHKCGLHDSLTFRVRSWVSELFVNNFLFPDVFYQSNCVLFVFYICDLHNWRFHRFGPLNRSVIGFSFRFLAFFFSIFRCIWFFFINISAYWEVIEEKQSVQKWVTKKKVWVRTYFDSIVNMNDWC